jgi:hypothetical protein
VVSIDNGFMEYQQEKKTAHRKDAEDTEVNDFPFAVERKAKGNRSVR